MLVDLGVLSVSIVSIGYTLGWFGVLSLSLTEGSHHPRGGYLRGMMKGWSVLD